MESLDRFGRGSGGDEDIHYPTRPVEREKAEQELVVNIKKATSPEETAPKQKHVRSAFRVYVLHRSVLTRMRRRVHCLHLGLPFVNIVLDWPEGSAHSVRRSTNVQGSHHRSQSVARRSSCGTCISNAISAVYKPSDRPSKKHMGRLDGWRPVLGRLVTNRREVSRLRN